jgi:integrase
LTFYDQFQNYLIQEAGLANNSIGTQIKDLKAFLNYVKKRGVIVSADLSDFKVLREKPVIVYLSQKELQTLYTYDFSKNQSLEIARDLFVLQSQTGFRYSDLSRLGIQHLDGNMLRMKAHKTKKDVKVPLTPIAAAILKKYNFELPIYTEQKQNKHIKQACRLAGIKQKIEIPSYHGGTKTYETFEKWKLITTHIAVKTFITHCGELGISPKVVSEVTGKTVKVIIDHYYGTNDKVIEEEMQKAFGVSGPSATNL